VLVPVVLDHVLFEIHVFGKDVAASEAEQFVQLRCVASAVSQQNIRIFDIKL